MTQNKIAYNVKANFIFVIKFAPQLLTKKKIVNIILEIKSAQNVKKDINQIIITNAKKKTIAFYTLK